MKKNFLLTTLAVAFTVAHAFDDDNRCNTSDASLAPGIYVLTDMCVN